MQPVPTRRRPQFYRDQPWQIGDPDIEDRGSGAIPMFSSPGMPRPLFPVTQPPPGPAGPIRVSELAPPGMGAQPVPQAPQAPLAPPPPPTPTASLQGPLATDRPPGGDATDAPSAGLFSGVGDWLRGGTEGGRASRGDAIGSALTQAAQGWMQAISDPRTRGLGLGMAAVGASQGLEHADNREQGSQLADLRAQAYLARANGGAGAGDPLKLSPGEIALDPVTHKEIGRGLDKPAGAGDGGEFAYLMEQSKNAAPGSPEAKRINDRLDMITKRAESGQGGYTLNPGEIRYGANNEVLARGAPKPAGGGGGNSLPGGQAQWEMEALAKYPESTETGKYLRQKIAGKAPNAPAGDPYLQYVNAVAGMPDDDPRKKMIQDRIDKMNTPSSGQKIEISNVMPNPNAPDEVNMPLDKPNTTKTQEAVLTAQNDIPQLEHISQVYDDSFGTFMGQMKQKGMRASEYLTGNNLSPEDQVMRDKYIEAKRAAAEFTGEKLHDRYGAALTPGEEKRAFGSLPDIDSDTFNEFKGKVGGTLRAIRAVDFRHRLNLAAGLNITDPQKMSDELGTYDLYENPASGLAKYAKRKNLQPEEFTRLAKQMGLMD